MAFFKKLKSSLAVPQETGITDIAEEVVRNTLRNSLSRRILDSLRRSPKWPFDLGEKPVDETERVILDFWAASNGFIRSDPGKLDQEAKNAFLDEMHKVAYVRLAELGMSPEQRAELGERSRNRYPEYFTAYEEFCREYPSPDALRQGGWIIRTFMPFSRAVTRNLFGVETKDVEVASRIITLVNNHFLVTAKTLKDRAMHRKVARSFKHTPKTHDPSGNKETET